MKKIILLMVLSLFLGGRAFCRIKLPPVISDKMVLQQNSDVKIWGWANPHEKISVRTDWNKKNYKTDADEKGNWVVKIKTTGAGGPYSISIEGENKIVLKDVLLGEVWICSGQSNMEFTINMLGGWENYKTEKADLEKTDYSKIRLCQIERKTSAEPVDSCNAKWMKADITTTQSFSALAFFYGRELYKKLKVPIGLISSNWGGTPAEAWTEKSYLQDDPDLSYYVSSSRETDWEAGKPSALYNAMIYPLLNYAIRGAIWYQGESNVYNADLYNKLFSSMIRNWRDRWGLGEFPFYFVQIAPFNYGDDFSASAYLREEQSKTLSLPNTGMAVTMDIGNPDDIHPVNKPEVARRLALWAFAKTYKLKVPAFSGPVYKSMKVEGERIRLFFDYTGSGLYTKGGKLTGFRIADAQMNFVDANAVIENSNVIVSNENIKSPAAVRFAFTNTDSSNLYNKEGLPATSFRTDTAKYYIMNVFSELKFDSEKKEFNLALLTKDKNAEIRYTLDGSEPTLASPKFTGPIPLSKTYTVYARASKNGMPAFGTMKFEYKKHLANFLKVKYELPYSEKYAAANEYALTDGLSGTANFRDGHWQGFLQTDLSAVIDLEEVKSITRITAGFLSNNNSAIYLPFSVEFSFSMDGINFRYPELILIDEDEGTVFIKKFSADFKKMQARYIKVRAVNRGICPEGKPFSGDKAWLFADEIAIE